MKNGVPYKGKLLTAVSAFWFCWIQNCFPEIKTHFITASWEMILNFVPQLRPFKDQLEGRSMLVFKMKRLIPVEGVVRGYLYGSGWRDYQKTGETSGVKLPAGLRQADRLPKPIFTPATKAVEGHDENLSIKEMIQRRLIRQEEADEIGELSLFLYRKVVEFAESKGLIIVDTKFEFGDTGTGIILIDEVFTSDSSRIWPKDQWRPGTRQEDWCLDKEYVREYLDGLCKDGKWDKTPPGLELPPEVVAECQRRYQKYHDLLFRN